MSDDVVGRPLNALQRAVIGAFAGGTYADIIHSKAPRRRLFQTGDPLLILINRELDDLDEEQADEAISRLTFLISEIHTAISALEEKHEDAA